MTSYVPNAFAGGGAAAPSAMSSALRSYAPNKMAGGAPMSGVTSMAPHLSVAAANRPYAADIAALQGDPEFASRVPGNLDQMWRQSPQSYEAQVSNMLRQQDAPGALQRIGEKKMIGTTRDIVDEDGNVRTQTYFDPMGDAGGWREPRRQREGE